MEKPDLSKLRVEVRWHEDMWQEVKNATMTTIGKDTGKYPDTNWKRRFQQKLFPSGLREVHLS